MTSLRLLVIKEVIPDASGTLSKIAHVNVTSVNSNRHGDMYSMMRPLDNAEKDYLQASVEDIYTRFVGLVSEGRGLDSEFVDSIAQGRVWAGSDALGIGLIDELGTLEDAVSYAAVQAGDTALADWNISSYPAPMTTMDSIMEMFGQSTSKANVFTGTPFEHVSSTIIRWADTWENESKDIMFARMPFEISFH